MEKIEFKALVESKARYDHLVKHLKIPLCDHCGREKDECDADPCAGVQAEEAQPGEPRVFEVSVFEKIYYTAYVRARSSEEAEAAVSKMDVEDWEPMRCDMDEYGYEISNRYWDIFEHEGEEIDKNRIIEAAEWLQEGDE